MPPLFEELRRALCVAPVRPSVRPYDLSTQLLLYYWQEIHQTFPDYSPWGVVVHEGGDSHYHISTKSYGPLLIFYAPAIRRIAKGIMFCTCPSVRPYEILSTQLLLNYWEEIHQTFPDYSPWCVVVHEGGDLHYRLSIKNYGPLLIFPICSI